MISKKEVQRIAKLARLDLKNKEIESLQKDLCSILDYVGKLKEIDSKLSDFTPTKHLVLSENVTREDKVRFEGKAKKLLDLAPQTEQDYLKVKLILK